jgi:peptidyl-prolyl cis-trans isomerase SurA
MTMEGFRQMTQEKMIVQSMRSQQFTDAPPPLPAEVRAEYNAIRNDLRDKSQDKIDFQKIFIPANDPQNLAATPESQLEFTEELAKQLRDGADFGEIARTHSRDAFASEGGVQLEVSRLDLAPEFASIIIDAPVGKVIGPLLDPAGFTIVQTLKLHPGPVPAFESVREQVEERVRRKKTSAQYERWIESRRQRAMIDIRR